MKNPSRRSNTRHPFIPGGNAINALPKSVDAVLGSTLRHYRLQGKLNTYASFRLWPEVVGQEFAKISFPEKITRGRILVVRVTDASYAQELALQKHEILRKFFELSADSGTAPSHFEDIRFVVSGPKSLAEREALK